MEWISIKDRLPKEDCPVLIIVSGQPAENITLVDAYELGSYYAGDGWCVEAYPWWENARVTHWMPLPAPPKEEYR